MVNNWLVVCGFASIPFICLYLFYTFLLISLPDYEKRVHPSVRVRLHAAVRPNTFYFVFLLPCLNEEKVILKTLEAILNLPYKHVLAIVIDDASDDNTAQVVKSLSDRRVRLLRRSLPSARTGKGSALNACYKRVNRAVFRLHIDPMEVIIGVIDGDGRPSLNLLSEAACCFANPRVGAAQARVRMTNREYLLPLMQDLEFATAVGAMQNAREYLGCVGLGGNGQFTRLSALRTLGESPWTACLLEDFDLGLRILLNAWEIRFISDAHVAQQGLVSPRKFVRQRARWVQGNMQCLRYTRDIMRAPLPRGAKLDLLYFLAQPWMNMYGTIVQFTAYITLIFVINSATVPSGSAAHALHHHPLGWSLRISAWLLLTISPGFIWVALYRRRFVKLGIKQWITATAFFPVYNLLVLPSVWIALFRHITRRNKWVKTERMAEQEHAPAL